MIKLNKKSKILAFGLAFTLLLALIRVYFLVVASKTELTGEYEIGSNQMNIFSAMQEAEKSVIYGEEGLSIAFQQSLYDIAANGGYKNTPQCGKPGSFVSWRKDDSTECFPDIETFRNGTADLTRERLNSRFLSKNPYTASLGAYKNNHEVTIEQKGSKTIARAVSYTPSSTPIMCNYGDPKQLGAGCGSYYYRIDMEKEADFDLGAFESVSNEAKVFSEKVADCNKTKTVAECVVKHLPAGWLIFSLSSDTVYIRVQTQGKLFAKNILTGFLGVEAPEIRFALSFP